MGGDVCAVLVLEEEAAVVLTTEVARDLLAEAGGGEVFARGFDDEGEGFVWVGGVGGGGEPQDVGQLVDLR